MAAGRLGIKGEAALGQSRHPLPASVARFEVASIKLVKGSIPFQVSFGPDGSLRMINQTTESLIKEGYPHFRADIVGLPSWAESERYNIVAKAPDGGLQPSADVRREMVRSLLVDRYGMVAHIEAREKPAYKLVLARPDGQLGPNLTASNETCSAGPSSEILPGRHPCRMTLKGHRYEGHTTIAQFAMTLRDLVGRVVIDETGLEGVYRIVFESSSRPFTGEVVRNGLPSVFTAVREQLGLTLEPAHAAIEVLVVDQLQRPTEN